MAFKRVIDFSSDFVSFAGCAFGGVATAGKDTNIDYTLSEDILLVGIEPVLDGNQAWDDFVKLQVVYGDAVVNEFGHKWFFSNGSLQNPVILSIPANIPVGLTIRVVYHSSGDADVKCKFNLHLYRQIV